VTVEEVQMPYRERPRRAPRSTTSGSRTRPLPHEALAGAAKVSPETQLDRDNGCVNCASLRVKQFEVPLPPRAVSALQVEHVVGIVSSRQGSGSIVGRLVG